MDYQGWVVHMCGKPYPTPGDNTLYPTAHITFPDGQTETLIPGDIISPKAHPSTQRIVVGTVFVADSSSASGVLQLVTSGFDPDPSKRSAPARSRSKSEQLRSSLSQNIGCPLRVTDVRAPVA